MPSSIFMNGGMNSTASTANTTQFWMLSGSDMDPFTTEATIQLTMRSRGKFHNFFLRLTASSTNASSTFTFRKNGANGIQSVSAGAATTGTFEDIVNSDAIVPGDKVNITSVPSTTGTFTPSIIAFLYDDESLPVGKLTSAYTINTSTTSFMALGGFINAVTTEANAKCRQRKSGQYQNMFTTVDTHTTGVLTFQSRKNGANGNLTTSYAANATGIVEDQTHIDSVVVGDDYCWSLAHTVSSTATTRLVGAEFICNANENFVQFCLGTSIGFSGTASANDFFSLDGWAKSGTSTESNFQYTIRQSGVFQELTALVQTAPTNTATLRFRKNGANASQAISITNATTGLVSDSTDVDPVLPGDSICHELTNGASTTAKLSYISIWASLGTYQPRHFNMMNPKTLVPVFGGVPVLMG